MAGIFLTVGWLAGAVGVLLTLVAAVGRLAGLYWIASYQAGTILLAGMALMLVGCLGFLAALASQRGSGSR
ncbi:MAG TPA: hypothetical protein VES73_02195 [Lamprocystis sp. (in: g-proteobacteria)]|nr:hypothetical protein [Lamprocystis sp. (in: g-proteobacteria)]